jgi:hypothetical protein
VGGNIPFVIIFVSSQFLSYPDIIRASAGVIHIRDKRCIVYINYGLGLGEEINMKEFRLVIIFLVLTILVFFFIICSCLGGAGATQSNETTGGAIDTTPIPANSEFLKEE